MLEVLIFCYQIWQLSISLTLNCHQKKKSQTVFSFSPSVSYRTTRMPCGFSCSLCYFLDATGNYWQLFLIKNTYAMEGGNKRLGLVFNSSFSPCVHFISVCAHENVKTLNFIFLIRAEHLKYLPCHELYLACCMYCLGFFKQFLWLKIL